MHHFDGYYPATTKEMDEKIVRLSYRAGVGMMIPIGNGMIKAYNWITHFESEDELIVGLDNLASRLDIDIEDIYYSHVDPRLLSASLTNQDVIKLMLKHGFDNLFVASSSTDGNGQRFGGSFSAGRTEDLRTEVYRAGEIFSLFMKSGKNAQDSIWANFERVFKS